MKRGTDFVNGWLIRERPDGGFEVFDGHGVVEGPFNTNEAAFAAAIRLPRPIDVRTLRQARNGPEQRP